MIKTLSIPGLLAAAFVLSGCESGLGPYRGGPDSVIATAQDTGRDGGTLIEGDAAIAYDPDGCQAWLVDDGIEGYSGRRFDPATGLPVCNSLYPPGTVLGNYQSQHPGLRDWVPGSRVTQ
jgi:hypothetical protein